VNPKENYVKRVIGVPGDRIHLSNRELYLNGRKMSEPYVVHKIPYPNEYRDNFPLAPPDGLVMERGMEMLQTNVQNGELWFLRATTMRWAITATTRSIRAIGAWFRARTSWASRRSFSGAMTLRRKL